MSKKHKTLAKYIREVEEMVIAFHGHKPVFLAGQIRKTAMDMQFLDRVAADIEQGELTDIETGSMGQMKRVTNPLLPLFDKYSARVTEDFYNLGLTARKQAAKDDTADRSAQDNIASLLADMKGGGT